MSNRAEDNAQWIREQIENHGLTDEIAQLAYTRYLARYAAPGVIDQMFETIVKELA